MGLHAFDSCLLVATFLLVFIDHMMNFQQNVVIIDA